MVDPLAHPAYPRVIGILGGLGPFAHVDLERRLLAEARRRGAARDADFPPWVLTSLPHTPDRTTWVAGDGPSPGPYLLRALQTLDDAGADFAVIACNTIHTALPEIAGRVPLPVAHVALETRDALIGRGAKRVGLLATTGTLASGLFASALAGTDIEVIAPRPDEQAELVMTAIYGPPGRGIKGGDDPSDRPRELLLRAGRLLADRGTDIVLSACSEISMSIADGDLPVPLIDTMDLLAAAAIDLASGRRDPSALPPPVDWPARAIE